MSTITIKADINAADVSFFQSLLKKLKAKNISIEEEKDDTKMTKEEYFAKIDEARAGKKIKMSRNEMRKLLLED